MVRSDVEVGDPEGSKQCASCYEWLKELSEHTRVKRYGDNGKFLSEDWYCEDCAKKQVLSDPSEVWDVDGKRQECPDCGSTAIKLIPFAPPDNSFSGAKFLCRACNKAADLEL